MNRRQLVVLWVGVVALAGVCLYPPWVHGVDVGRGIWRATRMVSQWAPLWVGDASWRIDYGRLALELAVVVVVCTAALLSLKNR